MSKKFVYFCMFLGSAIGGYLPLLWGGEAFSLTSIILSGIGGIIGIVVAIKIGENL